MSQDLRTLVERRSKVQNAFRSAKTLDEMLKLLPDLEDCFAESELGPPLLHLSIMHAEEGVDQEKTLLFAQRALGILVNDTDTDEKVLAAPIANATQLCGLTCLRLARYDESLYYLNTACRLVNKVRKDGSYVTGDVVSILHEAELGLFCVKKAVEKSEEAVIHLRNAMELGETVLKHGSEQLYSGYMRIANEYDGMENYLEALHFGFKALEILMRDPGLNPSEIAFCRKGLGRVFSKLNEGEKALDGSGTLQIQDALGQLELGRYDEAVDTLTATIPHTGEESDQRAILMASMSKTFASMGKNLWKLNKFADAKRCLEISLRILDKQESNCSPDLVVASLIEASEVYEKMKEIKTAIMISRRLLKMLEKLPQEQPLVRKVTGNIGRLLLCNDQVEEALPYLEDTVDKLKGIDGSKSYELGSAYNDLGAAYLALDRPKSAAWILEYAKDIMDVSLGPDHLESLGVWKNLSRAYAAMGSYYQALKLLKKVVEGFKGHGPSVQEKMDEAVELLEQFKEKARNDSS